MSSDEDVPGRGSVSRRVMRGFQPQALSNARRARGLSQAELARSAGMNPGTIRKWELGESSPQVDLLAKVADLLDLAVADLVKVPEEERYPGDWRVLRGMTQPQLGAAAGVTTRIVGSVERGEISLSDNAARRLSAALGISEAELRASYERVRNRPLGAPA